MSFSLLASTSLAEFNPSQTLSKRACTFINERFESFATKLHECDDVAKMVGNQGLSTSDLLAYYIKEVVEMASSLAHDSKRIRCKHVRAAIRSEADLCELLSVE